MTIELDLNIDNYSIFDIEKFFGLNDEYDFNNIRDSEKRINDILINDNSYDKNKKMQINNFLKTAKDKLIKNLKYNLDIQNNGFIEDYDKLLIKDDEKYVRNKTSVTSNGNSFVLYKDTTSINNSLNKNKYLDPIETYPTGISRSYLNNLKRKTIKQTIILNTLYREDYCNSLSTDFILVLPMYLKNVLSIRLSSIQIPNSLYCISKENKNNTIYLREDAVTGVEGVVIMPDGNYDELSFVQTLNDEIQAQLGTGNFLVSYNNDSKKIKIENTIPYEFTMNFYIDSVDLNNDSQTKTILNKEFSTRNCVDITELYRRMGWIMGYRQKEYTGYTSYETEGIFNGAFTNYIYFTLNDFNNSQSQNIIGIFPNSIVGNNILAMIPLNINNKNVCFDNGADFIEKKREYFGPINVHKFRIQLLNQYGEILDLNNMDFSFSLELEIGYDW